MKKFKRNIILSLFLVSPGLAHGQDISRNPARTSAKTAAKKKVKKKETVNELLQGLGSRGKNISINKKEFALPEAQLKKATPSVPLGQVKPPRSSDLFREAGTDEEKLEQVTEQGIQELYHLT